jgi:phosphoribosylamine--glycine ligase
LLAALAAAAAGDARGVSIAASDEAAVDVVLASRDYPEHGDAGTPIEGVDEARATGALVFHAGTALQGRTLVTNGGRILNVVASGRTVAEARARAYGAAEKISFAGMRYRTDIAADA